MVTRLARILREEQRRAVPRVPKYIVLARVIQRDIHTRQLKPGDQLPSESDLTRALPVSLGTIQKALRALTEHGVIERQHGRGTFVAARRVADEQLWHIRFLDDETRRVLPVYSKVHALERIEAPGAWAEFLGSYDYYICIRRTIDVNGEFQGVSEFFLPGPQYASLQTLPPSDLNGVSLRDFLRERYSTETLRVGEQIICDQLPDAVCAPLRLKRGAVGLMVHIYGFGIKDAPVYYQRYYFPPHGRRLEVRETKP
jgi:GntR family transcriptional regulator